MYAITGVSGKVGGAAAKALLAAGKPVRAVLRDAAKAAEWADRGCEIAIAEMEDASALARAFEGAAAVFVLPPSCFDPEPGFPEARTVISAVVQALEASRPDRVVCLSTIGAQAPQSNLLSQRTLMEQALSALQLPVTFLRPAWFLDNLAWDIAQAREQGVLSSFLHPLDRLFPMIATDDVGQAAAELLQQEWKGMRVVEIEGPERVSQEQIATALSAALKRPVQAQIVPRESWAALFRAQGMRDPTARIQMLDGFNEGWISFEETHGPVLKGRVGLADVVSKLVR